MINYLEDTLESLDEALDDLEAQNDLLDDLKRSGLGQTELAELEDLILEQTLAVKYLITKCNSIMEGNFEVVDLLKQ